MQAQQHPVDIFDTVPRHDHLGIFREGHSLQKVVDFLKFSKQEVASFTGVPKASIRYDERIPQELVTYLQEIGIICELVAEHFDGDKSKAALWFNIRNPALGNVSPRDMIRYGRYQKLVTFIKNAISGNNP